MTKNRTPIKQHKCLKRYGAILRRSPIRRVSKKQAKINREWAKQSTVAIDNVSGACMMRIANICTGRADGSHHATARAQGGNFEPRPIPCCWPCHLWAHNHPRLAADLGFSVSKKYA